MDLNPHAAIQSRYATLSGVMRKIADYVLEDMERIQDLSIQQLAGRLDIAESSVFRFCRLLGFSGYSEFKIKLAKYSATYANSIYDRLDGEDSVEAITRQVFSMYQEVLNKALESLDFDSLDRAAKQLREAKRIVVCSIGLSASIADNFAAHLLRIGFPVQSITDSELMQFQARQSGPGTLFIAISKTGNEIALVNACRLARESRAQTAALVCYPNTPIEAFCDVCIRHYYPTQALLTTRFVQETLLDCLVIIATSDRPQEVMDILTTNLAAEKVLHVQ